MMLKIFIYFFLFFFQIFFLYCAIAQPQVPGKSIWPDSIPWWKANNLRVIQVNMPDYEAGTLHPDSLLVDLENFSANTLIINAGGIMAYYPTKLDFQYTNPHMKPNMLGEVIKNCHQKGIKVIVRFDFSRVHESIFKQNPDWCYISPEGERIINTDMYVVSINAPYVQDRAFKIIEEVIELYDIDGIFLNMPGYQTRNPYEGVYHGIDQNEHDKKRFASYTNGLDLPLKEDKENEVFKKYEEFKKHTIEDWSERLHQTVKSRNKNIAICTYLEKHVDIIRHESQTNSLPYWPYSASDNVSNAVNSYPDHIISNASIQQISFQSRYNAVEPEEVEIRLYENIANGSGLDLSMMGDMRNYEDERNFEVFKKVYAHHKKWEPYFGRYASTARVALIAPGSWPGGEAMQEYRGIQLMLKEAHIQFDIIEDAQIGNLGNKIKNYKLIILPEITYLNPESKAVLRSASKGGTNLIATNKSLFDDPVILKDLFGAKIIQSDHDGSGFYLQPDPKSIFKRLDKQTMIFWKFNLGLYEFEESDAGILPILSPGRPGPPEIIGGHEPTGNYAAGLKNHGNSKAVIIPINIGKLYYLHGYEQHKNIILDIIEHVYPEASHAIQTNAHPRVEVILKRFTKNTPENWNKKTDDGLILHLVNITGFSGNTYFSPLPVTNTSFKMPCDFKPARIFSMVTEKEIPYTYKDGFLEFKITALAEFDGIIIEK